MGWSLESSNTGVVAPPVPRSSPGVTFGPTGDSTTISNQAVSSNFGWADGTDDDFGDSHRLRAFRFTLNQARQVTFTPETNPTATGTSVAGLLPGFFLVWLRLPG
jgi:hypothetical protein